MANNNKLERFSLIDWINSTIRNKLITIIILITVLSVVIVSIYAVWTISSTLQTKVVEEETLKLETLGLEVESFLQGLEQDVLYLSQSQSLAEYLRAQQEANLDEAVIAQRRKAVEQDFLAFSRARGGIYDQVRFLDEEGDEIVRVNTTFEEDFVVVSEDRLQNKGDRYYFVDSLAQPPLEVFVSPLDLNIEQGQIEVLPDGSYKPVIRYGTPVVFEGRVVGVIVTNVLAKHFLRILERSETLVYMTDQDGYYLYHPNEEKRWGRDLDTEITLASDYPQNVVQNLLSPEIGALTAEDSFFVHQPLSVTEQRTWFLGTVRPSDEVFAPVFNLIYGAIFVTLMTLAVGSGAAVLVGRTISAPIIELDDAASRIASGNFDVDIKQTGKDEIGSLAASFNRMTTRVRELITTLEQQVRERTQELVLSMEVGERASAIRDLEELLAVIVDFIEKQFDFYYVQIYFVDDVGENLVLRAGTGEIGHQLLERRHSLEIGGTSIVSRAVISRKSVIVPDTEKSDIHKPNDLLPKTRSELAIPLLIEDQVVGVLDLQDTRVNAFNEDNQTVFEAMGIQLANSIHSAQQWALAQEARSKAEEAIRQLTRESWANLLRTRRKGLGFSYDLSTIKPLDAKAQNGGKSIPVMVQNKAIGRLSVQSSPERNLTADEEELLSAVAQQLAQKAENLRLFEETQQQAAREQIARQIADKVRASRNIEIALKTATEELSKALGTSKAVVDLQLPSLGEEDEPQVKSQEQDNE